MIKSNNKMINKDRIIYFLAVITLLSFLSYSTNRYDNLLEQFEEETVVSKFLSNENLLYQNRSADDEQIFINAMINFKTVISQRLCVIKNIVESSISVAQISLPETSKDEKYDVTNVVVEGDEDIGGRYEDEIPEDNVQLIVVKDAKKCSHKKWIPDELKKKESIVGYTTRLVKHYNKKVLELNKMKIVISEFIDEFMRLLIENLDEKLLGRCDVCSTQDCTSILCINPSEDESIRLSSSKKLLIQKVESLETMLCEYTNLYKHLGDIQRVILQYTDELQDLITNKDKSIGGHMTLNLLKKQKAVRKGISLKADNKLIEGVRNTNNLLNFGRARGSFGFLSSNSQPSRKRFRGIRANNDVGRII